MSEPLLEVRGVDAFYGTGHILQEIEFEIGDESVAIVGRNGMGKTTLCASIMGLMPSLKGSVRGSIRFRGKELVGQAPYKIAQAGIGYIPQGRRLFPSLSVDEHLRILGRARGRWTSEKVYALFPRLAERRRNTGAQLSGGEQQMLAIGRALLSNPDLLIMDEPSEGLAPTVVESLIGTFDTLAREEGLRILLIEQNLGVATSLAERQLIMVGGKIATEMTATTLSSDAEAQRRYLGVEALAESE
jgi:branched-chain amino acid transport system ATP-binding protein